MDQDGLVARREEHRQVEERLEDLNHQLRAHNDQEIRNDDDRNYHEIVNNSKALARELRTISVHLDPIHPAIGRVQDGILNIPVQNTANSKLVIINQIEKFRPAEPQQIRTDYLISLTNFLNAREFVGMTNHLPNVIADVGADLEGFATMVNNMLNRLDEINRQATEVFPIIATDNDQN